MLLFQRHFRGQAFPPNGFRPIFPVSALGGFPVPGSDFRVAFSNPPSAVSAISALKPPPSKRRANRAEIPFTVPSPRPGP